MELTECDYCRKPFYDIDLYWDAFDNLFCEDCMDRIDEAEFTAYMILKTGINYEGKWCREDNRRVQISDGIDITVKTKEKKMNTDFAALLLIVVGITGIYVVAIATGDAMLCLKGSMLAACFCLWYINALYKGYKNFKDRLDRLRDEKDANQALMEEHGRNHWDW